MAGSEGLINLRLTEKLNVKLENWEGQAKSTIFAPRGLQVAFSLPKCTTEFASLPIRE